MSESGRLGPRPSFEAFYRAINHRTPFPWQRRLANQVDRDGVWPKEIGIPTGLGKTACLEIALWWLASQAGGGPAERTAPTRIWWVVNRRLLVDSTFDHAKSIRDKLRGSEASATGEGVDALRAVAARLRSFSAHPDTAEPLEVIRLRGGVHSRRPTDPSRPSIILSTVPMYGSRLLFRGYGTWGSMRPIDAALAGTDSLVLVDEAHLARHLMRLVPALSDCTAGSDDVLGLSRSRPQVVALTATGDAAPGDRFDLDDEDESHSTVRERLDASKPVEVRESSGDVGLRLAEAARDLLPERPNRGASCIVFANTPQTARAAFRYLVQSIPEAHAELLLLTGRNREWEAGRIRARILDGAQGMAAGRDSGRSRERHLIVVATQTLEVGADIDAEYLVTEACGVRALTQRLGRLNRMGRFAHAKGVYVHVPPARGNRRGPAAPDAWPVYGQEPMSVLQRLRGKSDPKTRKVSLSPREIAEVLGPPAEDPDRAPEVLPGILYEWVKTTTPPDGEAPVDPYFSGISGSDYSVSLIWRAHMPSDGDRLWPRASDAEAVSVPINDARQVLREDDRLCRLAADGMTVEDVTRMRPGDVIVLASDRGLLDRFGWDPEAEFPVRDLSIESHGLPLNAEALGRLFKDVSPDPFAETRLRRLVDRASGLQPDEEDLDAEAVGELLGILETAVPIAWEETEWRAFLANVSRDVIDGRKEVSRLPVSQKMETDPTSDELDERSLAETATELEAHGKAVAARSRSIGECLGLTAELVTVVEMAGRFHDLGKADRRFQRWLDPEQACAVPLAKSDMARHLWARERMASGWPSRGRHEVLSSRIVLRWMRSYETGIADPLRDLLVHLVISHHGHGRPIVPPATDDGPPAVVSTDINGERVEVSADLSQIDWDQPARFRRLNEKFGPWGLALLEAAVRQADHTVSSGAYIGELESEG